MNRQWDCIVLKNTYFQRIFMGIKKGIKKIVHWKILLWKIAPNSDPNPNRNPNQGGICWGEGGGGQYSGGQYSCHHKKEE